MNVMSELSYSPTHEWVKQSDEGVVCGISDHAQNELSDIVFVELPEVGKQVSKGDMLCVVESVKAASDIYAPISGTVEKVNDELAQTPDKLNSDPYGEGWICVIKPSDPTEIKGLLTADQYTAQLEGK